METDKNVCPVKVERRKKFPKRRVKLYHDLAWERVGKDKTGAELRKAYCRLCGYKVLPAVRFCRRCGLRLDRGWGGKGSLCKLCVRDATRGLQPVGEKEQTNDPN